MPNGRAGRCRPSLTHQPPYRLTRVSVSNAAFWLARHGDDSNAEPMALVTECSMQARVERSSPALGVVPRELEVVPWCGIPTPGGKFEKVTDRYAAYTDVVAKHIKACTAKQ